MSAFSANLNDSTTLTTSFATLTTLVNSSNTTSDFSYSNGVYTYNGTIPKNFSSKFTFVWAGANQFGYQLIITDQKSSQTITAGASNYGVTGFFMLPFSAANGNNNSTLFITLCPGDTVTIQGKTATSSATANLNLNVYMSQC